MQNRSSALVAATVLALGSLATAPAHANGWGNWQAGADNRCKAVAVTRLPGKTIVDVAVSSNDFSTLVGALTAANLVSTLQGPGPFTVFAPTNAAFAKIPQPVLGAIVSDPALLSAVLTYHVAPGRKDLRREDEPVAIKTVQGEQVFARARCDQGKMVLSVNNSSVVVAPIAVDNGIVYVIDRVLLPQF
jgi:uncharacterized surface protein with fasciclin (FAS1) repeats